MSAKFKLMHTFGNVIHSGTKQECELVRNAFNTYGLSSHKFEIVEEKLPIMSDLTRDKIYSALANLRRETMFGDGLEDDYIYSGTTIVGLHEMTDPELIEELELYGSEDPETELNELYNKAKAELEIDAILTKEQQEEE